MDYWKVTAYPGYSHGTFKEIVLLLVYSDPSHAHCIISMWHCHAENNLICIELLYSTQISWLFPWYLIISWDIFIYFKDIFSYFIPRSSSSITQWSKKSIITLTWILAVNWHIFNLHRLWTCNNVHAWSKCDQF